MKKIVLALFLLICICYASTVCGQASNPQIIRDSIYSNIFKEERILDIRLPQHYDPGSNKRYEMIYAIDAEWSAGTISQICGFLGNEFMPPNIVVGINHTPSGKGNMRDRDLTPTYSPENSPISGGAAFFLSFIKNELIPYINKKYPSSGINTFYGSSYGGLFGMYVLLKEPRLFDTYLLGDPSLWWDRGYIKKMAADSLSSLKDIPLSLLITGREGYPIRQMGIADMDSILRAKAPPSLRWKIKKYDDETHTSIIFRTVYDGLKFTYAGFSKEGPEFNPTGGIMLQDRPIDIFFSNNLIQNTRYTTDGSLPTPSSPLVTGKITLKAPATLTLRAFCSRGHYDHIGTGHFISGTAIPAFARAKNTIPGGLHYTYYEGDWDKMPYFKNLKPVSSGLAGKDFSIGNLPRKRHVACVEEGQLEIQTEGYYIFFMDCDGLAKLYLGNKLLVNNDEHHVSGKFQSFVLPLAKGFYPIRLEYFQKNGNPSLTLLYTRQGAGNPVAIPSELLYTSQ